MKKIVLLFILMLPIAAVLKAQEETSSKDRITQVLQSEENYLYADQTCATVEQALQRAQDILMREIEAYLQQSGEEGEVVKGTVTEQMVTVTVQRGDKYRAFVYINKAELGATHQEMPIEKVSVVEQTIIPEAVMTDTTQKTMAVETTEESGILEQIVSMTSRLQVYDYINELKKDGENITFYEHPNTEEQDNMYLILYKRGGKIEAILTPIDSQGIRHNLATGQPDSKNNHPATSVNGFIYEQ